MNWETFTEARNVIAGLRPEQFDYNVIDPQLGKCGCVVYHAHESGMIRYPGTMAFALALGITWEESSYLFGLRRADVGPGIDYYNMGTKALGCEGIREALRRFDVVAWRYGGWPVEADEVPAEAEAAHSV